MSTVDEKTSINKDIEMAEIVEIDDSLSKYSPRSFALVSSDSEE